MKKILLAVLVLSLAGFAGVLLGTAPAAEYARNPYYRNARWLEKEYEFIDVLQFKSNDNNEIVMGIIFVAESTEKEMNAFTKSLDKQFQQHVTEDTQLAVIWVVVQGGDGNFYANGLFTVSGDDLRSEGITIETLMPSQQIYMRWVMGAPVRFAEGTWPWIGR